MNDRLEGAGIRVLLAEDDTDVRETTALILERRGFVVDVAADGILALEAVARRAPEIAVVDVAMPRMDGLSLTRELVRARIPVILLTARDLAIDVINGLDTGADDYVTKPFEAAVLAARIRAVLRRHHSAETVTENLGDLTIDRTAMTVRRGEETIPLTGTEFRLLSVLLNHRGAALSRNQIVSYVWGSEGWDYQRVVDTNIQRLRRKLDSDAIHTVRGIGYRIDAS